MGLSGLLAFAAGRRAKYIVMVGALLVAIVAGPLAGKFEDAQKNDPASFLPGDTESLKALDLANQFPSGEVAAVLSVFQREGGLTDSDRRFVNQLARDFNQDPPPHAEASSAPVISPDQTAAIVITPIAGDYGTDTLFDATDDIRERIAEAPPGLTAKLTGPAGYSADAVKVFANINGTLLLATDPLAKRARWSIVDRNARKGQLPSDHAPVIVDFAD